MVNFPSRPNLRPVDPPPLGASVRHPLSLPHPGIRPRTGRGQFEISNLRLKSPSYRWPSARTIKAESRQKPQQSRLIKPYQGKRHISHATRHPAQELPHLCTSAFICGQIPPFCAFCVFRGYPPDHRNPKSVPGSPPIKAENPCNRA